MDAPAHRGVRSVTPTVRHRKGKKMTGQSSRGKGSCAVAASRQRASSIVLDCRPASLAKRQACIAQIAPVKISHEDSRLEVASCIKFLGRKADSMASVECCGGFKHTRSMIFRESERAVRDLYAICTLNIQIVTIMTDLTIARSISYVFCPGRA